MTGYPSDSVTSQSNPARRSSLLSARKLALMASAVTGLGVAAYGLGAAPDFNVLASPAQAQVNNTVSNVPQPIGFADMVDRVKPSVISVKVTMKQKATDTSEKSDDEGSRPRRPAWCNDGPGFWLLHLIRWLCRHQQPRRRRRRED